MPTGAGEVSGKGPGRRLDLDPVTGPDIVDQPAGQRTTRYLAHANPQRPPGGRADRIRPPLLAPVHDPAQRERLAGLERVVVRQLARPDLPFACKGGVCGTCRARLVSGEVRMRRNFALEQAELDAGFVLTCQSLPVSEELTVDYDA
jgi:ferredoxin